MTPEDFRAPPAPSLDTEKRKIAVKLYPEGNHTVPEICRLVGVSKPTLYSYVHQRVQ